MDEGMKGSLMQWGFGGAEHSPLLYSLARPDTPLPHALARPAVTSLTRSAFHHCTNASARSRDKRRQARSCD